MDRKENGRIQSNLCVLIMEKEEFGGYFKSMLNEMEWKILIISMRLKSLMKWSGRF